MSALRSLTLINICGHSESVADFKTAQDVRNGDRKPGAAAPSGQRQLDADELAAIQRMLQED